MKKTILLAFLILPMLVFTKEIDMSKTQVRNNLIYEVNKKEPFTGTVIVHYETGQLQGEGSFKNGQLDGPHKVYYKNGKLQ